MIIIVILLVTIIIIVILLVTVILIIIIAIMQRIIITSTGQYPDHESECPELSRLLLRRVAVDPSSTPRPLSSSLFGG